MPDIEVRGIRVNLPLENKAAPKTRITHEIKNPLNFVNHFAGLSVELLDELKGAAATGIATLDEDTGAEIDETVEMLTGNLAEITEHGRRADGSSAACSNIRAAPRASRAQST